MSHGPRTLHGVIENVVARAYGRPASLALGAAIQAAKQDGLLRPVTVIVPSNFAGLSARRLLGSGEVGPSGIANVNFVTPFRLAEILAAGRLGDRRPLTNPVLGAAVRKALAEDPRHFAEVADHHATESALARLAGELSSVSELSLRRIESEAGWSAASAIAFFRSISSHLGAFHDEADVARAASRRSDLTEAVKPLGHLVWYLPGPTTRPLTEFLKVAFEAAASTVIVGVTGDNDADQAVWQTCEVAGVVKPASAGEGVTPPHAGAMISVTDADEEVRAVIREVVALAESGTPLDRIGIFHPTPDPYVRILEQQFAAAGIPANGPSRGKLAESVAGRTLLGALALPAQRWRRDRVMAVVNSGPLRQADGPVRPSAWETLSRQAGVVQGLSDWQVKLEIRSKALVHQRTEAESAGHQWLIDKIDREANDLGELRAFVSTLDDQVGAIDSAASWSQKSAASLAMMQQLLGPAHRHTSWPEAEQVAFERVEASLERLAGLDEIESSPSREVFLRALSSELDVARGRSGRFGEGVVYGPLSSSVGHDLDAVFLLGCAEGMCPRPRRDDSMLPDAARSLANGELELRLGQLGEQHRQFLAALASAPQSTLLFARGDLRGGRRARPSRWLLDSATALAGQPVYATEFDEATPAVVIEVPSYASGLLNAASFASLDERDLSSVHRAALAGVDARHHPATHAVGRGLDAQAARASRDFTEWDGNLLGAPIPSTAERPLSPTSLETWAACGFRYFLGAVLGLGDRDDPERMIELSPLDRGSGVHAVLERFLLEIIEEGPPSPGTPWTQQQRERVQQLAAEVFDDYEGRGRTGRPVRWKITKSDLLALLDDFLIADNVHRAVTRSTPERVELPFGMKGAEPLKLTLDDGRTLQFRGMADRVDRGVDGRLFVTDYKTGRGKEYDKIADGDPVQGGKMLQLGMYAEAARQQLGADEVDAHYWMVNAAANHKRSGYPWTADRRERMLGVLGTIVDGIEGGVFAASPGEWNSYRGTHASCTYCPFDSVCPSARGEQALEKLAAPGLAVRQGLELQGLELQGLELEETV